MSKIKLSDYIAKRLKEKYKIEHFYMVSGGGAMHLNDSLGKELKYIANHHEQASAMAAEGDFRVSGKLAVVNVTTGPGGLNCLNGVFGQWTDSAAVLYISGQVKYETTIRSCSSLNLRQLGDQEVDIIKIVSPLTKYAKMVTDPKEIKYHIDRAVYEALNGRFGPVWLDIPMNVQSSVIEEDELIDFVIPKSSKKDLRIDEVIKKINESKSPLIVAGQGIRLSNQIEVLNNILKKTDIPVVTTFNGMDIIKNDNKNFVGRIGTLGQRSGNFAIKNADLIISLGTRNNIRQVGYNWESFGKDAYKISVDIDRAELDKPTFIPDMKIEADLADFMPNLDKNLKSYECKNWLNFSKEINNRYLFENIEEYKTKMKGKLNVYDFTYNLTKNLKGEEIIIAGNGSACVSLYQVGIVKGNQRIIYNSGDASMGYDLPAAIGACIANGRDNKEIICLTGDGSIMMNLQELQTIKHYKLPIKIFIINNSGYVSIRQTQNNFFEGHLTGSSNNTGVSMPNFCKIAEGFGIRSIIIKTINDLRKNIKEILTTKDPLICEVMVEDNYKFIPKVSSKKLEDGSMISTSIEDMYPFLSEIEYKKNVITK